MKELLKQLSKPTKAILTVVLVAFLGIAVFAIASYPRDMQKIFVDTSVETMQKNLNASAVFANESIESNYSDVLILQDALKVSLDKSDNIGKGVLTAMETVKKRSGFDNVGIMRADSDLLFATMSDGTRQQLDMWMLEEEVELGKITVDMQTSPFQTADGGYDAVVYRSHFKSASGKEYLLIAEKSQSTLDKLLSSEQTTDGLSLIVRDNGNVVYSRGSLNGGNFVSYNLYAYLQGLGGVEGTVNDFAEGIAHEQAGTADFTLNGTDCTFIFHRIENTNWVCVQGYSKEALAGSNLATVNSKTMQLVALVAIMIVAVLAAIAIIGMHRIREKGQHELLEREHLFEEMSHHIPSAIVITEDDKREPRFISHNFHEVIQNGPVSFAGPDIAEWLGSKITPENAAQHNETGRTETDLELGDRVLRVGIYSLGLINGHEYNVMIATDITSEVNSRKLLEASMARADEASRSKSSFLSSMSHEIRTPLNAVLGFSKLALGKWDSATRSELHEYLEKIQTSGEYLLDLVSDVLDISRIEEGRMEVSTTPTALGSLVGEVRDAFQGQMSTKKIKYEVEENFDPIVLNMDAFHVRQILNNLVSNACKYTEEGGTVRFSTSLTRLDANQASVRFEVQDNGIGMPQEFLEHIFEPFTQDERGAKMKKQLRGSGLGMSICKNLVDLQNGTIAVESEVGKGSRFTVQLTFDIVDDAQGAGDTAASLDVSCLAGKHVLIADDVDLNRLVLGDFLEEYGIGYDEVENGQEAVDAFMASEPGSYLAIFMDGRMPIMNGYEATGAIRESTKADAATVPIIAMTADAFSSDVNHAIMCGMNYHLAKPLDFDKVLGILVSICADKE